MEFLISFFTDYGYWAVLFVLIICGFGVPIPEDITLVSGGVIAGLYPESVNSHLMLVVSMIGVLAGDSTCTGLAAFTVRVFCVFVQCVN